ncbi:hypothetical protein Dimus_027349, partial [Dionaea muscipula]
MGGCPCRAAAARCKGDDEELAKALAARRKKVVASAARLLAALGEGGCRLGYSLLAQGLCARCSPKGSVSVALRSPRGSVSRRVSLVVGYCCSLRGMLHTCGQLGGLHAR